MTKALRASLFLLLMVPGLLRADTLILKNGDKVVGKIISLNRNQVVIQTEFGRMTYQKSEIKFLHYAEEKKGKKKKNPTWPYLALELGQGFPALEALNAGISGREYQLRSSYPGQGLSLHRLRHSLPLSLKFGGYFFPGAVSGRFAPYIRAGYAFCNSHNRFRFNDSVVNVEYNLSAIQLELGTDFTLFRMRFLDQDDRYAKPFIVELNLGIGGLLYPTFFSIQRSEEPQVTTDDLSAYPLNYTGLAWGYSLSISLLVSLGSHFRVGIGCCYRVARAATLEGDVRQGDGIRRLEQLYIEEGMFVSSPMPPAAASRADVDFSGPILYLGCYWSLGDALPVN